jgi:ribosomal protein S18 acetylase RimI-like enzyme
MSEIKARFATDDDRELTQKFDSIVTDDIFRFKVDHNELIIGELDGESVGYLRLEYWYLALPFIGLIVVEEEHRNKGVGRAMLTFLEEHLVKSGYDLIHSSSDVSEPEPQAWHRHMGFKDCGIITGMNDNGASEVIFRKNL